MQPAETQNINEKIEGNINKNSNTNNDNSAKDSPRIDASSEVRLVRVKQIQRISIKLSSAALFAALSLVLSLLAPYLPRVQWGLALFDPVSIVWILAFFLFGYYTGLITTVIGTLLLMPFDSFAPIGPLMKFFATIPLILVPLLVNYIMKKPRTFDTLLDKKFVHINWIFAVIVRNIVMVILNYVIIKLLFEGPYFVIAEQNLAFLGLPNITGWTAIFITVIFVNTLQSIWDYYIPFALVKIIKPQIKSFW
ncbi:MAG: hypothetical protein ACTSU2_10280 [Promethearchaeota archaeon]